MPFAFIPRLPASTQGQFNGVLADEANRHSSHQAAILVQGHHNWESRFHRINTRLPSGVLAQEVVAESWPAENLVDACVDCVDSWRHSPGHWEAVRTRHPLFGFDIQRGRNGIWYATGIFGRHAQFDAAATRRSVLPAVLEARLRRKCSLCRFRGQPRPCVGHVLRNFIVLPNVRASLQVEGMFPFLKQRHCSFCATWCRLCHAILRLGSGSWRYSAGVKCLRKRHFCCSGRSCLPRIDPTGEHIFSHGNDTPPPALPVVMVRHEASNSAGRRAAPFVVQRFRRCCRDGPSPVADRWWRHRAIRRKALR